MVQYEHINDDNKQSKTWYMVQYEHNMNTSMMITNKVRHTWYNMNTLVMITNKIRHT